MEGIGAAFQGNIDGTAAGVPVLSVVGAGHDFEFLHRVHRGDDGDRSHLVVDGIVGRAIQQEFDRAADAAVDGPRSVRAVRERLLVQSGAAGVNDAVGECGQHDRIAGIDGQIDHLLVVDQQSAIGLLRFGQQRRFRRNGNLLRLRAYFQHHWQCGGVVHGQFYVPALEGFEARHGGDELIFAGI